MNVVFRATYLRWTRRHLRIVAVFGNRASPRRSPAGRAPTVLVTAPTPAPRTRGRCLHRLPPRSNFGLGAGGSVYVFENDCVCV